MQITKAVFFGKGEIATGIGGVMFFALSGHEIDLTQEVVKEIFRPF